MLPPILCKLPGMVISIELAARAGQDTPVLLAPQYIRVTRRDFLAVLLEFITGFTHEDGQMIRSVVFLQHLGIRREVCIHGIELDQRLPARIIEGSAVGKVEQDRLEMFGVNGLNTSRHREHDGIVVLHFAMSESRSRATRRCLRSACICDRDTARRRTTS